MAYRESKFRLTRDKLAGLTVYTVTASVWRRPYGVGSFTLYQTLEYSTSTDLTGTFVIDDVVPLDRGYETYVTGCVATLFK